MQIENGDMNKCKFSGKFSFVVGYFVSLCPKSPLNLDLVGTFFPPRQQDCIFISSENILKKIVKIDSLKNTKIK